MLMSVVYLSVFYFIGMLISVATRRTSTALMLSMFIWGFLVLVYPNMILAVVPRPEAPQARAASAYSQIEQIWEEFDRERKQFLKNDAFPGESSDFSMMASGWYSGGYFYRSSSTLRYFYRKPLYLERLKEDAESRVPHAQNYYGFLGPRVTDTAEKHGLSESPPLRKSWFNPQIWKAFG